MSSSARIDSSLEAFLENKKTKPGLRLTERLCEVSHFLFRSRVKLRYGRLSRAPLKLLRLQLFPEMVECDCLARAADPWDADLPDRIGRRHFSLQALRDAIELRALLFEAVPDVGEAHFRIFRETAAGIRELVIVGDTHRNDQSARGVHSLTMRAKVLGFRFRIEDEWLIPVSDQGYSWRPSVEHNDTA